MQKIVLGQVALVHVQNHEYLKMYRDAFGDRLPARVIQFGLPIDFDELDAVTDHQMKTFRSELDLGDNDIVVICGFYAKPEKQHKYIIDEIASLPESNQKRMAFIFPLSYGDAAYANEIRNYASEVLGSTVKWRTIDTFLDNQQVAVLRRISDIVINVSVHDCMSATLLESLYCGAITINGSWLRYSQISNEGIFDRKLECCDDNLLKDLLISIADDFSNQKEKTVSNKNAIRRYGSWEKVISQWLEMYEKT